MQLKKKGIKVVEVEEKEVRGFLNKKKIKERLIEKVTMVI